jgi:hypothetical protein|tara:strand:+ start:505 stop:813 length:309 start_codon:yes stop_codon:yes gene_type:complete
MNTLTIISGVLVAFLSLSAYIIRNLMLKVEKYEEVTQDQVSYLQTISQAITEGKKHLDEIDTKGTFKSDDEVGYYFEQLKIVQSELDRYMLPKNYGKKEIQE